MFLVLLAFFGWDLSMVVGDRAVVFVFLVFLAYFGWDLSMVVGDEAGGGVVGGWWFIFGRNRLLRLVFGLYWVVFGFVGYF